MSKILFTPTKNNSCPENLFGGVVWRSSFIKQPDSDFRRPCAKLTTLVSKMVFYYHQSIFRRDVDLQLRWITFDFSPSVIRHLQAQRCMPCFVEWEYLVKFATHFTPIEQETSSEIRTVFYSFVRILRFIHSRGTLFLIRLNQFSNRQQAMDLLVQVASLILNNLSHLTISDTLCLEEAMRAIKPMDVVKDYPSVTERAFDFVLSGDSTYYYSTYQLCPHDNDKGCTNCQITHTDHMSHLRSFLASTHVRDPPIRNL